MDEEDGCKSKYKLLPPGFRFHPMDDEIITHYLWEKVVDNNFKARAIGEVDLNNCEPWDLPSKAKNIGEKEWYFFFHKDRKYPTGMRTNRATKAGYWKATGKDKEIYKGRENNLVGMKKTLVFYMGRAPKGEKTNWIMHEYRLEGKACYHLPTNAKDEWSVCRVFNKKAETKRSSDESNNQMTFGRKKSSSIDNIYLDDDDKLLESHPNNLIDDFNLNFSTTIPSTQIFHTQTSVTETLIFPRSHLGKGRDTDYCLNQGLMGNCNNNQGDYYSQLCLMQVASDDDLQDHTRISTIDKNKQLEMISLPEEDVGCCQYYEEIQSLWK